MHEAGRETQSHPAPLATVHIKGQHGSLPWAAGTEAVADCSVLEGV